MIVIAFNRSISIEKSPSPSPLPFIIDIDVNIRYLSTQVREGSPQGGGLPYEIAGDARRKLRIKPLKETNLGVAQALFDP